MAHYLVELYSPKPAWLALSFLHRTDFLDQVKTNIEALPGLGIQLLTLSQISADADQAVPYRFLGVWSLPSQEACEAMLAGIRASGWYDYFDHVNAVGAAGGVDVHLADLLQVK
ncbi:MULTISPECIES: DUF6616 family protein [Chromobacterium]|uniref:DUF4286 domain-containing protein n=2 Tax=Chromobacterium TaxID=535 RepID=A0ABS3GPP6_9NEIS|nr:MULTISPECIES: DUF6616 family protein [Chromobacterium]AXT45415.1 hypothetical protein D1345_04070 [Chromobacterium rhizoryzae]MBK0416843.1 hypothetical protein [Chromobacterium haemolyticum]MBO0417032.1 hypothetical protein [Chromobacterium haemolyticum]MBO0501231.1 hypothetical protein [Chromobacterium haemolyticum]MDH0341690.1 hypothetical protein [Chromobacterium haemolyticum]